MRRPDPSKIIRTSRDYALMLYSELSEAYSRIEAKSSRLSMMDELIDLLSKVRGAEFEMVIRLTKGEIGPGYEGIELGVAEKLMDKALYQVTMMPLDHIEERRLLLGDVGLMAEEVIRTKKQTSLFSEPLTVERVFRNLERISITEGKDSQDLKLKIIAEMMHDASPLEAKYLARTMCQRLRLGIADMTIIDALAYLTTDGFERLSFELASLKNDERSERIVRDLRSKRTGPLYELEEMVSHPLKYGFDKADGRDVLEKVCLLKERISSNREGIVRTYNVHPDLGHIARRLSEDGIEALTTIKVMPGIPLRSMLGERLCSIKEIIDKMGGEAGLEYKYDGLRVQAHLFKKGGERRTRFFSRQLEDITEQFPDVVRALEKVMAFDDCIVEGECVPIDPDTGELLPFQLISQRRGRKYDLERMVKEVPVNLVLFDCLYHNGKDLTGSSYLERRAALKKVFPTLTEGILPSSQVSLSVMRLVKTQEEGESFFESALESGCEGIMAKSTANGSIYQAGSRGWLWIKYKKDYRSEISDTLDLVVVGAFHGTGRRKGTYGALLMAAYDPVSDTFVTTCKLGSGFNDEHLRQILVMLEGQVVPKESMWDRVDSKIEPDVRINPKLVLEVLGAEITFSPLHTCALGRLRLGAGLSVRFPRFTGRFRDDKGPEQATTAKEMESMYTAQRRTVSD